MARRPPFPRIFGILLASAAAAPTPAAEPDGIEFFEQKIRPVLVEHCYECHSSQSKAPKGGLLLDTRAGLLHGGDSGPAIVPDSADESLLLDALRYDSFEMPPAGRLPDSVIKDFERWIAMGAPDPRTDAPATASKSIDIEAGRAFWAYQLPQAQMPPPVADAAWPYNDVDRFVLARLDEAGLSPAPDADRRVLIHRLYYDLIGLTPSPEEVEAFVNDPSADAYERLVDRLLASPHFGERWGRHWLDVARYAESITLRGFVLKDAWRYRDYVIASFNEDRPFDRFVREQIAGDLLPRESLDERRRAVVATAFLALGNTNLEEQDKRQLDMDIVDEQLDVISRGLLAQTVTCARCHDHKFDPIPTRDYYALAGILKNVKTVEHANVSKWLELPLPLEPDAQERFDALAAELAAVQAEIKELKSAGKGSAEPGVISPGALPGIVVDDVQATKVGEWTSSQFSRRYVGQSYIHDGNTGKGEKTVTFIPDLPRDGRYEVRLSYTHSENRAKRVPITVFSADGERELTIDQTQEPAIDGRFVSLGQYRFERAGQSYVIVSNEGTQGHVIADAVQFLPAEQAAAEAAAAPGPPDDEAADAAERIKALEKRVKQLTAALDKRPTWIGIEERKDVSDTAVHIRGSVHNLGEPVPRGFLQVATYGAPPEFSLAESGRRELADWLASRDNPLTARVIVNRAWLWLFGEGLVRTPDNFGTTGDLPTHPELLDGLAVRFMDEGWSIKQLVRTLVLSRTYRQSSIADANAVAADPENRLWSHANRRRKDAESLRDAILVLSGTLQRDQTGPTYAEPGKAPPATDYNFAHADTRRSVYAPAFRNSPVELFEAFDMADPSMVTGRRNVSTVAPQALYLMNHPFVIEHSRLAARRLLDEDLTDEQRVDRAYQLILGRAPTDGEREVIDRFLSESPADEPIERERQWTQLVQTLICSIDFRYVD